MAERDVSRGARVRLRSWGIAGLLAITVATALAGCKLSGELPQAGPTPATSTTPGSGTTASPTTDPGATATPTATSPGTTAPTTPAPTTTRSTNPPAPPPNPQPPANCSTTHHVPGGGDGMGGCWPGPDNTGVPAGVTLTNYTGPCTITTNNTVISAKRVTCSLTIRASGVVIEKSSITGHVASSGGSSSFTLADSVVNLSPNGEAVQDTGVGDSNYTMVRTEVIGGNRGVYCAKNCTIRDSWVHGQVIKDDWHSSGIRMEQYTNVIHNSIACDAKNNSQGGGCSAPLTGYGDFAAVQNNTIQANLFVAGNGSGFCAYGGSSAGKPYSNQAANIHFIDNVFQRGSSGKCGYYAAIGDWDPSRPGNTWVNNRFEDGVQIPNQRS